MLRRLQGKFSIDSVIEEIRKLEKEIRANYEEVIDCDAETLAWMFTLDASFLLEILRSYLEEMSRPANYGQYFEPVFDKYKIEHNGIDILHDILKLENQIPLVVLRKLLELEVGSIEGANDMLSELLFYGGPLRRFYPFTRGSLLFYGGQLGVHKCIPKPGRREEQISDLSRKRIVLPSALDLHNAGIRYKSYEGVLSKISDKEVADLINGLCKGFTFSSDAFHEVRSHVYQQYRSEWKVMIAQFAEEHCSRPWRTICLLAAILLLAMAAVQTFYSIYK
eukprot:Gb_36109 [translate_table: standard]